MCWGLANASGRLLVVCALRIFPRRTQSPIRGKQTARHSQPYLMQPLVSKTRWFHTHKCFPERRSKTKRDRQRGEDTRMSEKFRNDMNIGRYKTCHLQGCLQHANPNWRLRVYINLGQGYAGYTKVQDPERVDRGYGAWSTTSLGRLQSTHYCRTSLPFPRWLHQVIE